MYRSRRTMDDRTLMIKTARRFKANSRPLPPRRIRNRRNVVAVGARGEKGGQSRRLVPLLLLKTLFLVLAEIHGQALRERLPGRAKEGVVVLQVTAMPL